MTLKLLLPVALICMIVNAQTFEWVETVPLEIQTNPAYLHSPSALDGNGNPVCARLVNFRELYSTAYYGDIEIEKRDPSGHLLWSDTIYGKTDVSEIITDGENSVVCNGTYMDTLKVGNFYLVYNGQGTAGFILKLDSTGNPVWLKDASEFVSGYGSVTALTNDGLNNILIGTSDYPVESKVLTLDAEGGIVSSIEQSGTATVSDIDLDVSANTWVTGFTFSGSVSFNGVDTTAPFVYNEYVVKYNPAGIPLWVSFIQDVTVQFFNIETDNTGNAYLSGNLLDSTSFGNLHANGPQWVYDFFVTKINPVGEFIWLNEIPPGNTAGDAFTGPDNFLACRGDGHTFLTGYFRGEINFGSGVIINSTDYSDAFVISYDQDGEVKWAKAEGGSSYDQGSGITVDESGNCYLSGLVSQNYVFDTISAAGGEYNLFLAKLRTENAVSVENTKSAVNSFGLDQNYPNPFNPSTKIRYSVQAAEFVTLKIFDILGREIKTLVNENKPAGTYEVDFNAANIPSGIYFYNLTAGNFTDVKKMMVLK
jgi:hypothetical protein